MTEDLFSHGPAVPSTDETFQQLQQSFIRRYPSIFQNDLAEKTVIIVPSLTLDPEMLRTIKGIAHYEERLLCMLMLLRMPKTQIIYLSSVPIDATIIDYYLHMLPGITVYHAAQRLTLLSCHDASRISLTEKILARPRLMKRIRELVRHPEMAHISCFNVTECEKALSVQLNIPVYGTDPVLLPLATKSGARELFRQTGIPLPPGVEYVKDEQGIIDALAILKIQEPELQRAVIKTEDGFSGEGNAIFSYGNLRIEDPEFTIKIREELRSNLKIVASNVDYCSYLRKFEYAGGIVETFIEGAIKESPSVQCRINPLGTTDIISTHDQVLGGPCGQVFTGAVFPANPAYSRAISAMSIRVAEALKTKGVLGRFGIDFLSVYENGAWKHYGIEINLRKGGTTHPFLMLQFLTAGSYNCEEGIYHMPGGGSRCYYASDNVFSDRYRGLTPHDLIDIAVCNHLMFDSGRQWGVMFHMIGALSQYGKLGMVCIADTRENALELYHTTIAVLDRETAG